MARQEKRRFPPHHSAALGGVFTRSLRQRAPLLGLLLPLIAGLLVGRFFTPDWPAWPLAVGAVAAACAGLGLTWSGRRGWWLGLVSSVFLSGWTLMHLAQQSLPVWDTLPPRELDARVQVERVFTQPPPTHERPRVVVSGLGRLVQVPAMMAELEGQRVYFRLTALRDGEPLLRTTELAVRGVVEQVRPVEGADGDFARYLVDTGVNFQMGRGRVLDVTRPPSTYARVCAQVFVWLQTQLDRGIEGQPSLRGVYRAMLLGQTKELSDAQKEAFVQSGTLHLFSISGLHIAVIALAVQGLLVWLPVPSWVRWLLGAVLLWLYVDSTGCSPSAVRAFLMVTLVQAARWLWLPGGTWSALVTSACVVVIGAPWQLFSASFQLSYGIVAGLLLLGLPLGEVWTQRWALFARLPPSAWRWHHRVLNHCWRGLLQTLAMGLAATLVSTVYGVLLFELFTPASLVANLALIPISSLVIWAGFASMLAGAVGLGGLGVVFNHAAILVIWWIEALVAVFVRIPGVYAAAQFEPGWAGWLTLGLLLACLLAGHRLGWARRWGGYWSPFVLVGLAVLLGVKFGGTS